MLTGNLPKADCTVSVDNRPPEPTLPGHSEKEMGHEIQGDHVMIKQLEDQIGDMDSLGGKD